jgi:NAD(P)-dependent dehydrogenase (short-subunit alcohol dehydrogenase family)
MTVRPPVNFSTDLTGRVALVTGASSGLGVRFAQVLAASGAKVAVAGRRRERLEAVAAEIREAGGVAAAVVLDVSKSAEIAPAVDAVEAALGRVDILVNNAGVPDQRHATRMSLEEVDRAFDTNLRGPWILSCEVARRLIAAKAPGWVVNIASMGAYVYSGRAAAAALYTTTKAGLVRMTEAHAMEWAKFNINVNAIAPGTFESEMMDGMIERVGDGFLKAFPRPRMGRPDQLDSTLLFLVSPASDFVTGTCVKVDDGQCSR